MNFSNNSHIRAIDICFIDQHKALVDLYQKGLNSGTTVELSNALLGIDLQAKYVIELLLKTKTDDISHWFFKANTMILIISTCYNNHKEETKNFLNKSGEIKISSSTYKKLIHNHHKWLRKFGPYCGTDGKEIIIETRGEYGLRAFANVLGKVFKL